MSSMRIFLLLSVVAMMVSVLGCGSGGAPAVPESDSDAAVMGIQEMLSSIAKTGIADEESMDEMKGLVTDLEGTDAANADAILSGLEAIEGAEGAEAIKAEAQKILSAL